MTKIFTLTNGVSVETFQTAVSLIANRHTDDAVRQSARKLIRSSKKNNKFAIDDDSGQLCALLTKHRIGKVRDA